MAWEHLDGNLTVFMKDKGGTILPVMTWSPKPEDLEIYENPYELYVEWAGQRFQLHTERPFDSSQIPQESDESK